MYCFYLVIRGGLRVLYKGEGVSGLIKLIFIFYWFYNVSDCYFCLFRMDGIYIFIVSFKVSVVC